MKFKTYPKPPTLTWEEITSDPKGAQAILDAYAAECRKVEVENYGIIKEVSDLLAVGDNLDGKGKLKNSVSQAIRRAAPCPIRDVSNILQVAAAPYLQGFRISEYIYSSTVPGAIEKVRMLTQRHLKEVEAAKQAETRHTKAVKILVEAGISVEGKEPKVLIREAEEVLAQKYRDEHYPDGAYVSIDCCGECTRWIVGEKRCGCGSCRVDLEQSGSFLDGTGYLYPAPW